MWLPMHAETPEQWLGERVHATADRLLERRIRRESLLHGLIQKQISKGQETHARMMCHHLPNRNAGHPWRKSRSCSIH